ncbi:MAG: DUF4157 domain-containing protein [Myxococcota bacterium]
MKSADAEVRMHEDVHALAHHGVQGTCQKLPHLTQIQASFGRHDISGISAFVGGRAAEASEAMGAQAYATGNAVAFKSTPDLHTAAHEAAHVIQQKAGVSLKGGVGQVGDRYEQHADAVADAVVQGRSAESLLNPFASGGQHTAVQRASVQMKDPDDPEPLSEEEVNSMIAQLEEAKHNLQGSLCARSPHRPPRSVPRW